jgi:hypothetical protein
LSEEWRSYWIKRWGEINLFLWPYIHTQDIFFSRSMIFICRCMYLYVCRNRHTYRCLRIFVNFLDIFV